MAILNCLWVGVLGGLVGSRLIRTHSGYAPAASTVAVGVLGALLGGLADAWIGTGSSELPHVDIVAAGAGAAMALVLWTVAQRLFLSKPTQRSPSPGGDRAAHPHVVSPRLDAFSGMRGLRRDRSEV